MSSGARGGDGAGQQPSASTSAQEQQPAAAQPPKRGRGRPRKAPQEPTGEPSPKRPRGRPKGSKNKSPSKAAQKKAEATGEKRPRGRPRKWNSYCRYSTPEGLHTLTPDWNINLTTPTEEGQCNPHRTALLPQWSPHKRGKDSDPSHHDLSPNRVPLRGHCCSTLLPRKHQPQQVVQKKPTQEQTEETSSQESAEVD